MVFLHWEIVKDQGIWQGQRVRSSVGVFGEARFMHSAGDRGAVIDANKARFDGDMRQCHISEDCSGNEFRCVEGEITNEIRQQGSALSSAICCPVPSTIS
eukprot:8859503-Ditylum_brightwellii.AAC.1